MSKPTVARKIKSFHYSLKRIIKKPERRNNPKTVEICRDNASNFYALTGQISDTNVIFVDEMGFCISMRASRGRSVNSKAVNHDSILEFIRDLKSKLSATTNNLRYG